jgi:hypothetical protein
MTIALTAPIKVRRRSTLGIPSSTAAVRVRLIVEPPKQAPPAEDASTAPPTTTAALVATTPAPLTPVLLKGSVKIKVLEAINLVNTEVLGVV